MEKSDGRRRTPIAQRKARKLVVDLRNEGVSNQEAAKQAGLSVSHASKIWQSYKKEGKSAIRRRKRGRRLGEQRVLPPAKEEMICALIRSGIPEQNFYFTLWTHQKVKILIRQKCRVEMPIRTVREYLKRWGFTAQKPIKKVSEQNSQAMNLWLETEYPAIVARAKEEKAEIHWISSQREQKTLLTMLSAIDTRGKVRFLLRRAPWPFSLFLAVFMERLLADTKGKVFVILDNLRSHHDKNIEYFLTRYDGKIKIFHLPLNTKDSGSEST